MIRNVSISDNTIIRHRGKLLHAHGVGGLTFAGNRVVDSTHYPVESLETPVELGPGVIDFRIEIEQPVCTEIA